MEEQMPFYEALGLPCSAVFKNTHEKEILGAGEELPWKWEDTRRAWLPQSVKLKTEEVQMLWKCINRVNTRREKTHLKKKKERINVPKDIGK